MDIFTQDADGIKNVAAKEGIALLDEFSQLLKKFFAEFHLGSIPGDAELVSSKMNTHIQLFFNDLQVAVLFPCKLLHQMVVVESYLCGGCLSFMLAL